MNNRQLDEEAIFHFARQIEADDARKTYLEQACAGDGCLRDRVESLLAIHFRDRRLPISTPADDHPDVSPKNPASASDATLEHAPLRERVGETIGPYKLREKIGEGGMGVVYVAEQERPVRRKVAIKIIKPGMDTKEVIARFEAERQALALMDHPNIAKVLDAGATAAGHPFFVMELIRGVPIPEYCDSQGSSTRERLELFISICRAVQHAHSKGVIHRDLKPGNILISPHDGVPVVKIIDFGIAKAVGQQLTDKTIYTQLSQMIGTPLYMSPEQAQLNALDVDTRSDVYSLGVLLYELITGATPFDRARFASAAHDEIRRIIREEEPPVPSRRLSSLGDTLKSVSMLRKTEPGRLVRTVKGELDWITMRCLEKDRSRRYQTAIDLANDVGRYLANEPVAAVPPSSWYRTRKVIARHRLPLAVLAAFLAILTAFVATVIHSEARFRAIAQSLQEELLDKAFNASLNGELAPALEAIDRAQDVGVPEHLTETLRGISLATAGRRKEAIAIFEKLVRERKDRVAGAALVWTYYDFGEVAKTEQFYDELVSRDDEPTDIAEMDIGKVFLARLNTYGVGKAHDKAIEDLSGVIGLHRLWGMAYYARAEAYRDRFVSTREMRDLLLAMEDDQVARFLLPQSDVVKKASLLLHLDAYRFALGQPGVVDKTRQESWRELADRLAAELSSTLSSWDGAAIALAYYRATGQEALDRQLEARIEHDYWYLQPIRDLNWFIARDTASLQEEMEGSVYTKHIYAIALLENGDKRKAREILDSTLLQCKRNADATVSAIEVLELMQDFAAARELAVRYLRSGDNRELWDWPAVVVQLYSGDLTEQRLLERANPFHQELCMAQYNIGLWHLVRGSREAAKTHFRAAIDTGRIGWGGYHRAKAFLQRLDENPRWPQK